MAKNRINYPQVTSKTDEWHRAIISALQVVADQAAGGNTDILAALGDLSTEVTLNDVNLNVDDLERSNVAIEAAIELIEPKITPKSKLYRLENEAEDTITTIAYLDAGVKIDRREDTVILSSVSLGISITKTFAYDGIAGDYYLITVTLS